MKLLARRKKELSLLMMCLIGSSHYSNVYPTQASKKMVTITALVTLVAATWYIGYQHGLYSGKQAGPNETKDPVTNQQKS